ncbi:MAG: hypothetical protein HKN47_10295 [Pirellulaceae bacterium]|nr:hypothetical protein [Pirellulaceae bacterium]
MNPMISRIALLSYLIGGWLLPLLHHHEHTHRFDERVVVSAGTTPLDTQSSHEGCSHCHHHHEPASFGGSESDGKPLSATLVIVDDSSRQPGIRSGRSGQCVGLCTLCVARSTSSVRPLANRSTLSTITVCQLLPWADSLPPLTAVGDSHGPRGPPTRV